MELGNHLGNVLVTVSDKKKGVDTDNDDEADYYEAEVLSANDYYPFGWAMPGRKFNSGDYRFGFNGTEKVPEINNGHNTTFFREQDTRIARWWSIDPKNREFESPYAMIGNNPILYSDMLGDTVKIESVSDDVTDVFKDKLNKESNGALSISNGQLILSDPDDIDSCDPFMEMMIDYIYNPNVVTFKLVGATDDIFNDAYDSGEVDVDDMNNLSSSVFKLTLIHFTEERFVTPDYDNLSSRMRKKMFPDAHGKAHDAEARLLQKMYPDLSPKFTLIDGKYEFQAQNINRIKSTYSGSIGTVDEYTSFGPIIKVYRNNYKKINHPEGDHHGDEGPFFLQTNPYDSFLLINGEKKP